MSTIRSVFAAREHLLADGQIPEHLMNAVRPTVLQSWKRSMLSGARPDSESLVFHGADNARTALRIAADPILSRLAEQLVDLDAGVLLADNEANIVRRWVADSSIKAMLDRINSNAGFNVSEEHIGTNGVGSIIEQGTAFQVSGPEHLAEALSSFTCVGVPIHHPISRRLEGVITLSCRASAANPLLTPLMTSTAQEVEHRMLGQATVAERHLLDEYLVAIGARRAPIAAVGKDIFIAGPRVTELLEGVDRALLWEHVRAIALGARTAGGDVGLSTERFRIARCQPVERDGKIVGALVELEVPRPEKSEPGGALPTARATVTLPGKSAALAQTIAHATRLAAKGVPILIEGESGVGKYTLARAVLDSAQVNPEKIAVIDAAVGWVDGAARFISVLKRELEMAPEALLLRHLESLAPETAAASASIIEQLVDGVQSIRVIATLTRTPDQPIGELRRLIDTVGVGRVVLAPLRDRREDIAPTAVALLAKHRGTKSVVFSSAAVRCLMRAPWPGNVRQLDATVRGLISTTMGAEIRPESLPTELQGNSRTRDLSAIEELELVAILEALHRHKGNKVAAAQSVGISRSTLYRKLQAYHVDPDKQYF